MKPNNDKLMRKASSSAQKSHKKRTSHKYLPGNKPPAVITSTSCSSSALSAKTDRPHWNPHKQFNSDEEYLRHKKRSNKIRDSKKEHKLHRCASEESSESSDDSFYDKPSLTKIPKKIKSFNSESKTSMSAEQEFPGIVLPNRYDRLKETCRFITPLRNVKQLN